MSTEYEAAQEIRGAIQDLTDRLEHATHEFEKRISEDLADHFGRANRVYQYSNAYNEDDRAAMAASGWRLHTVIPGYYRANGAWHNHAYVMEKEVK